MYIRYKSDDESYSYDYMKLRVLRGGRFRTKHIDLLRIMESLGQELRTYVHLSEDDSIRAISRSINAFRYLILPSQNVVKYLNYKVSNDLDYSDAGGLSNDKAIKWLLTDVSRYTKLPQINKESLTVVKFMVNSAGEDFIPEEIRDKYRVEIELIKYNNYDVVKHLLTTNELMEFWLGCHNYILHYPQDLVRYDSPLKIITTGKIKLFYSKKFVARILNEKIAKYYKYCPISILRNVILTEEANIDLKTLEIIFEDLIKKEGIDEAVKFYKDIIYNRQLTETVDKTNILQYNKMLKLDGIKCYVKYVELFDICIRSPYPLIFDVSDIFKIASNNLSISVFKHAGIFDKLTAHEQSLRSLPFGRYTNLSLGLTVDEFISYMFGYHHITGYECVAATKSPVHNVKLWLHAAHNISDFNEEDKLNEELLLDGGYQVVEKLINQFDSSKPDTINRFIHYIQISRHALIDCLDESRVAAVLKHSPKLILGIENVNYLTSYDFNRELLKCGYLIPIGDITREDLYFSVLLRDKLIWSKTIWNYQEARFIVNLPRCASDINFRFHSGF